MKRTEIYSVFGQIEGVVADAMAEEGLVHKIARDMMPATARFDDQGRVAHCAIILNSEMLAVYNRRVADLYA